MAIRRPTRSVVVPARTSARAATPTPARAARHRRSDDNDAQNEDADGGEYGKYRVLQQTVTVKEHGQLNVDLGESFPTTRRQDADRQKGPGITRQALEALAIHGSVVDRTVHRQDAS